MILLSEPTYLILLALLKEPMHGYGIIKTIFDVSEGQYEIAPGTLYGVLKNIEKQKLIEVVGVDLDNRKKKIYAITQAGRNTLIEEQRRYEKLLSFTYKFKHEG
ncbi:PadR family transcriptional regulator [Solibacillus silvestris]|uniref:PadR family transcriptional regulator n=1 Tax=Solibacillus silvestris TaxID=76853 RepID=UPI003F812D7D